MTALTSSYALEMQTPDAHEAEEDQEEDSGFLHDQRTRYGAAISGNRTDQRFEHLSMNCRVEGNHRSLLTRS